MAVGAKDHIDQMLVKRYASEQTNNPEDSNYLGITRDRYWEIMGDVATVQASMIKAANVIKKGLSPKQNKQAQNKA